jgi:hypothetical protein
MLLSTLFSLSADLALVDVRLEHEGLTLVLRSNQTNAACPECAQPSTHVHGHYTRRLADLPCQKRPVRVCLKVRRFACRTRGCSGTTFAERFPRLSRAYARRTLRQAESLTEIAFAQGGKAGAQLAKRLAMPTSRDTLLRLMRSSEIPKRKTPRVLGLDDFGATRSRMCSCKDSRKEALTWGSAPECPTRLNQVRLGQCSRVHQDGNRPVRREYDC